jgi:hypothetical protein
LDLGRFATVRHRGRHEGCVYGELTVMHWNGPWWPMDVMMVGSILLVARRILAERYTRGELNPDEYTTRLAALR